MPKSARFAYYRYASIQIYVAEVGRSPAFLCSRKLVLNVRVTGIASQLLAALAVLVERQFTAGWTAILHVQQTNIAAFCLYTQLGFRIRANQPMYYRGAKYGGSAALEMVKDM